MKEAVRKIEKKSMVLFLVFCVLYLLVSFLPVYGYTVYSPSGQLYGTPNAAYAPNGGTVGIYPEIGSCGSNDLIKSTITLNKTSFVPLEPIIVNNEYLSVLNCMAGVQKVYTFATVIQTNSTPPDISSLFNALPNADYQYEMFPAMDPGVYTNRTNTLYAPSTPGQYYIHLFVYGYYTTQQRYAVGFVRLPFTVASASTDIDSGLRVHKNGVTYKIAAQPLGTLTSPLRMSKNGNTYGILLVDPSDPTATALRIRTSTGTKALKAFP